MSRNKASRWAAAAGRAGLVAFLALAAAVNGASISGGQYLAPVIASAVVCAVAVLVPRLRWPLAPFLVTAVTAWWGWLTVPLLGIVMFDLAVARRMRVALGCAAVALGANLFGYPATRVWADQRYVSALFVLLLGVVVGLWLGNRRRLLQALAADVEHLRIEAQLREEAARIAERSRIAAEMHDVLAHRLSLIALHTGVLSTRSDMLPAPVAERLGLLRTTSVEALTDLRDVLGVLRGPDATPTSTALTPVMRAVGELADEARAAGQHIELTTDGLPERAPTTHRLAVYRIVQEALTNSRKHADGAPVTVRIDYGPSATLVEVTNPPGTPRTDTVGSGYGLVGLRERVTALGGHLDSGPVGAGAWRLAARIPQPVGIEQNGTPT
ncbi:sensor histidine kinase [Streptomyces sp. IB201691-2A2]|uniref:sensor histidine kinase n=1 Tax=Streptomyces sp. IB201691-2A2 TaxID=2561920 RepID=UPI0011809D98|nr:histidine kinase [Streptomyces sp. IB201691-2A2]TRO56541.1 two-component sensor histidine kinase [Streptomyces sp. IB201691-2A2]